MLIAKKKKREKISDISYSSDENQNWIFKSEFNLNITRMYPHST